MAEQLWANITERNDIMFAAEQLIPYFKTFKKDENGNPARYVSIQDIDYEQKIIGGINNIDLRVKVLSNNGNWVHTLLIREFQTIELMDDELKRYAELDLRCSIYDNIYPYPMVHVDKNTKQIIYESPNGLKFSDLSLSIDLQYYLIGTILAMIQGSKSFPLDIDKMKDIMSLLIKTIPFTKKEQEAITNLVEPHFYLLPNCMGGYRPMTLYDPYSMIFIPQISEEQITINNVTTAYKIVIPMNITEDNIVDRMTDISNFIVLNAYDEFKKTGNVIYNKKLIKNFFSGYNQHARKNGYSKLEELYPHGITLDLQLTISFLIVQYSYLQENKEFILEKDAIRFIYFLLMKKPFLLF